MYLRSAALSASATAAWVGITHAVGQRVTVFFDKELEDGGVILGLGHERFSHRGGSTAQIAPEYD
jgi:hypothetical protein